MAAAPITRRDLEACLIEKAWKDPDFRKQVVRDPKGTLEKYLGQKLPEDVKIFVHEEDAHTLHLSIPPAPALTELSEEELDKVAGGVTDVGGGPPPPPPPSTPPPYRPGSGGNAVA